jgi:hypothetical protein
LNIDKRENSSPVHQQIQTGGQDRMMPLQDILVIDHGRKVINEPVRAAWRLESAGQLRCDPRFSDIAVGEGSKGI